MIQDQQAQQILQAGQARARELGVAAVFAVLDEGAHLKAFHRMDQAVLGSIDIAQRKARTAVLFHAPSEAVWEYSQPGAPAPFLELSNGGLAPYAGGLPLFDARGELLGAVGVSGGSIVQDLEIARAAAEAFRNALS